MWVMQRNGLNQPDVVVTFQSRKPHRICAILKQAAVHREGLRYIPLVSKIHLPEGSLVESDTHAVILPIGHALQSHIHCDRQAGTGSVMRDRQLLIHWL